MFELTAHNLVRAEDIERIISTVNSDAPLLFVDERGMYHAVTAVVEIPDQFGSLVFQTTKDTANVKFRGSDYSTWRTAFEPAPTWPEEEAT